jgi:hypothetical protein
LRRVVNSLGFRSDKKLRKRFPRGRIRNPDR